MAFNFGFSAESAVRNTRRPLTPWNIHDVKFIGCEISEGISKNDSSKNWKRLDVKFENEEGYFNVPLWFPKEEDGVRRTTTGKNGGVIAFASNFEVLMATVAQIAKVLNPSGFEKMQAASSKFRNFDDVAKALVQILDKVKGTETKLKLVGSTYNGKVTTKIPTIVAVRNSGEFAEVPVEERPSYVSDNFIGNKLFFSEYEENQRQAFFNSKPTEMPSKVDDVNIPEEDNNSDDFDLESLL